MSELRREEDLAEVWANLLQDVLAGSTQHDGAGLGLSTLHQEREVLVSVLPHLKETALCSHVALLQFIRTIADGRSTCPEREIQTERDRERNIEMKL